MTSTRTPARRLRRIFRERRRRLSARQRKDHAFLVARAAATESSLLNVRAAAIYLPNHTDGELDTGPLISRLEARRIRLYLPVVRGREMRFHRSRPGDALTTNRFGIPEPPATAPIANGRSLDVVFTPLVCFDDAGTRMGMGMGYYDRYLGRIPEALRPRIVGIAHGVQRSTERLHRQPWDVPLDAIVTEAGWQDTAAGAP